MIGLDLSRAGYLEIIPFQVTERLFSIKYAGLSVEERLTFFLH